MNLFDEEKEESKCKGIVYRGVVSSYISSHNSVEVRKSLRILKRESCPGCSKCGWMNDFINEDIWGGDFHSVDYLPNIENGKKYRLQISTYHDHETGYSEVDGSEFVEVKDE
jgi:hypothetical protein